jgi:hypothetical protein
MSLGDLQPIVAALVPAAMEAAIAIGRDLGGVLAWLDRIEARLGGKARRDGDAGL